MLFRSFPREDGSTGNAFNSDATLCITTTCRDKACPWAFIRSTLEEDFQKSLWNFPILKSAFEANAKEAMPQEYETDADGNQSLDENGNPCLLYTSVFEVIDACALHADTVFHASLLKKIVTDQVFPL